ncbi:hypothetical protein [Metabacillus litoralis]|uniref:hypothetical protein n=1 Tax=Metabacillus litoralis TaxID=152268 RepID=UPI001CFCF56D|nr:hypothetical protein [Metabacillus litoralis]
MFITTILILISLLLHVVAFYFIVVLYMKYSTMKNLSDNQRKILEETENSMTSFLIEMKDENDRLIQQLTNKSPISTPNVNLNGNQNSQNNKEVIKPKNFDTKLDNLANDSEEMLPKHLSKIEDVKDTLEISKTPKSEKIPFEIEVLNLFENGLSIEQIAKKFNKGKTEIELILKFRQ